MMEQIFWLAALEKTFWLITSVAVLGVLVFIHELGHFLIAKWCGVTVFEFAIGFGKKLLSFQYGETTYSIRAIPLGGFVRMAGDDPTVTVAEGELAAVPQEKWYLKKSVGKRAAIIIGGPAFNWISACLFAALSFAIYGKVTEPNLPVIGGVFPGMPAEQAGIKPGDKVLSINGQSVADWISLSTLVRSSSGEELKVLVERVNENQEVEQIEITTRGTSPTDEMKLLEGKPEAEIKDQGVRLGIVPKVEREPVGLGEALVSGFDQAVGVSQLTFRILGALFDGSVSPTKVLGGPITVFTGAAQSAKHGMESLLDFVVLLSVSLAIFNLLPIPILDGGHLLFLLIESVIRKPLSPTVLGYANQVGMVLLFCLMAFALSNDLFRLM